MKRICLSKCPVFFKKVFSKSQCGYRKGYNTEQCLSAPLKKWKTSVLGGIAFGALLTDLSKAFSWLDLKSFHSYLSDRKRRANINNSYSKWRAIMFGVNQGSLPGPLLNNVFFTDLFFMCRDIDIANRQDDNMPYISTEKVNEFMESLEQALVYLFKQFEHNLLKGNADKFDFLVSNDEEVTLNIDVLT